VTIFDLHVQHNECSQWHWLYVFKCKIIKLSFFIQLNFSSGLVGFNVEYMKTNAQCCHRKTTCDRCGIKYIFTDCFDFLSIQWLLSYSTFNILRSSSIGVRLYLKDLQNIFWSFKLKFTIWVWSNKWLLRYSSFNVLRLPSIKCWRLSLFDRFTKYGLVI
jgi:hypothetical protein